MLLQRGADWFSGLRVDTRIVVSPSTPEGLRRLAEQEEADIVVFGSDYRTAPGHVAPQHSTQAMLEGGTTAVAIAPAGYHGEWAPRIHRIGVLAIPGDDATLATARALADSFGATLTRDEPQVDLLVVGSRLEAPPGRVMISAHAQNEIENATCPVLVVPHGVTIDFPAVLAHAGLALTARSGGCRRTRARGSRRRARLRTSAPAARGRSAPRASAGATPRARASR